MANFNLNKVIFGGRLCADPELKTAGGVALVSVTIAANRRFKNKDGGIDADFVPVQFWRQQAELVARYFKKGSSICVVGALQSRSWTDQNGQKRYSLGLVADEVYFVDSKGDSVAPGTAPASAPSDGAAVPPPPTWENVPDDELPF